MLLVASPSFVNCNSVKRLPSRLCRLEMYGALHSFMVILFRVTGILQDCVEA